MKRPLPEPFVFFVDRSLGRGVAEALRQAGATAEHHDDHFAQDAPDQDWLGKVGRRGWLVLTKDKEIRRRTLEREALHAAGVRAFVLTSGNLRGAEMAEIFVRQRRRMERLARRTPPPFIARVTRTSVELYP